jgi:hypothetical protein
LVSLYWYSMMHSQQNFIRWTLLCHDNPWFSFTCTPLIIYLPRYPNSWNIPPSPAVTDLPQSLLEGCLQMLITWILCSARHCKVYTHKTSVADSVAAPSKRRHARWDCGFESCRMHGCLSLVSVECCRGLCVELVTRPDDSYLMSCVWVWSWSFDKKTLYHYGMLRHGKTPRFIAHRE